MLTDLQPELQITIVWLKVCGAISGGIVRVFGLHETV